MGALTTDIRGHVLTSLEEMKPVQVVTAPKYQAGPQEKDPEMNRSSTTLKMILGVSCVVGFIPINIPMIVLSILILDSPFISVYPAH